MADENLEVPKGGGDMDDVESTKSELDVGLKDAVEANLKGGDKTEEQKAADEKAAKEAEEAKVAADEKAKAEALEKMTPEEKAEAEKKAAAEKAELEDDLLEIGKQKPDEKKVIKGDDETDDVIKLEVPEDLSDKSKADWNTLKTQSNEEIGSRDKTIAERDQTIVELNERIDKNQDSEKMEALAKQNAALSQKLEEVDLKNSPAFKDKYTSPKAAMVKGLEEHFKTHNVDENVSDLLKLSGAELAAKVDEINEKLPGMAKQDTIDTIRSYQALVAQEGEALSNSDVANTMLNAKLDGDIEESFKLSIDGLKNESGRMLDIQKIPDDASPERKKFIEESNASVEAMEEVAKKVASGDVTQDEINQIASVYSWALHTFEFTMPEIQAKFNSMVAKVQSYKKEMDAILAMNPDLSADLSQKTPEEIAKIKAAKEDGDYDQKEFEDSVRSNISDNLRK